MTAEKMLTPFQAAERVGLARATLAKRRVTGGGPPFRKLGSRVFYPEGELSAWLAAQPLYTSTAANLSRYSGRRRGRPSRAT
jgi:predicted DNA-binding transcriptional regulator AlpA